MDPRLARYTLAASLVLTPVASLAQSAPAHPEGALPFGQWTIVNGHVDESGIVWSQCRSSNGQAGRWIATRPAEVVHPTYVVRRDSQQGPESRLGTLVECVGEDGAPGVAAPAVPATSILPRGTTLVYGSSVTVHQLDAAARHVRSTAFGLRDNESAFDDGAGPVVVTASRILVFPQMSTLNVGGANGGTMSIYRPGTAVPAPPTACRVVVYDAHGASRDVGVETGSCIALSYEERQRVVRDARAQLASAPR